MELLVGSDAQPLEPRRMNSAPSDRLDYVGISELLCAGSRESGGLGFSAVAVSIVICLDVLRI